MKRPAQRQIQRFLLASASALAVFAAAPQLAKAADFSEAAEVPAPPPPTSIWWVAVEGSFTLWNPLNLWWGIQDEAIAGIVCDPTSPSDCEPEQSQFRTDPLRLRGWGGALELGVKPAGTGFDLVLRGRYDRTNIRHISGTWGYYGGDDPDGGEADYQEHHIAVDFEVGRELGVGNMRVFGGARFAHFDGHTAFSTYQYETDHADEPIDFGGDQTRTGTIERTFWGIGPRIEINGSLPLGGGAVGIDFGASVAALFGERNTTVSYKLSNLDFGSSSTTFAIVPNVEASAALAFMPSAHSKLAIGYRVDAYWNVMDIGLPNVEDGPNKQNRIIHGPFAKWTVSFN